MGGMQYLCVETIVNFRPTKIKFHLQRFKDGFKYFQVDTIFK